MCTVNSHMLDLVSWTDPERITDPAQIHCHQPACRGVVLFFFEPPDVSYLNRAVLKPGHFSRAFFAVKTNSMLTIIQGDG